MSVAAGAGRAGRFRARLDAPGTGIRTARSGATASSNASTSCSECSQTNSVSHGSSPSGDHGLCSSSASARARGRPPIADRLGRMNRRPRTPCHHPLIRTLPSSVKIRSSSNPGDEKPPTEVCAASPATPRRFLAHPTILRTANASGRAPSTQSTTDRLRTTGQIVAPQGAQVPARVVPQFHGSTTVAAARPLRALDQREWDALAVARQHEHASTDQARSVCAPGLYRCPVQLEASSGFPPAMATSRTDDHAEHRAGRQLRPLAKPRLQRREAPAEEPRIVCQQPSAMWSGPSGDPR